MKSDETKPTLFPIVVYFGHSEDHAETDSGWELRKHERSEDTVDSNNIEVVETTPTSKMRPETVVHARRSQFSSRHTLFPQATDDFMTGDDTLISRPVKRTRRVSEIMWKLVRPNEHSESTCNEGSESSTSTDRISTSTLPISP